MRNRHAINLLFALCTVLIHQPLTAAPEDFCNVRKPAPMNSYRAGGVGITDFIRDKRNASLGVFFQTTVTVSYQAGQWVWLQGILRNGAFIVDDTLHLDASPSGLHWERDFHDAAQDRLLASEGPQDITHLLVPGDNQLTVTLENRMGTHSGSTPLSFMIWMPCISPTATMTRTPLATATPWPRPNATPIPTVAPTLTTRVSAVVKLAPTRAPDTTATAQPLLPVASPPIAPPPIEAANRGSVWLGLALTSGCLWWVMRRYRRL